MTSIEWTDETWNPVVGCSIVSAGCEHCYAMGVAHRGMSAEHRGLTVLRAHGKGPRWTGEVRFLADRLAEPLRWKKPRRVFVNSMSDLFHEALTFEQIAAVVGVMASCPRHAFQVLTKRPERARDWFLWYEGTSGAGASAYAAVLEARGRGIETGWPVVAGGRCIEPDWPLANVHLGVSVEDQKTADERIPALLEIPAAIRWVSYEPALGPVDFTALDVLGQTRTAAHPHDPVVRLDALRGHLRSPDELVARLDWIVVGGESGARARPFDIDWARSTVRACAAAGVPCFVKQLGGNPRVTGSGSDFRAVRWDGVSPMVGVVLSSRKGGDMDEWPPDLRVRQWPEVRS